MKSLYLILTLLISMGSQLIHAATITQTYTNNTPASVDPNSTNNINRSVTVPALDFPANSLITDVNIAITFDKRDRNNGICSTYPADNGRVYNGEITFRLTSPSGTVVDLVTSGSGYYSGNGYPNNVTVTFDDEGAIFAGTTPTSGTFQPQGSLASFDNVTTIDGTWTLFMSDSAGQDPLCFFSYDLIIEATSDADISVTKSDSSPSYTPGEDSVYSIVVSNGGPIDVDGITVTDTIPSGASSSSWVCIPSGGASCSAAAGVGDISSIPVDIPNGDSVEFIVTITWSTDPSDY